MKKITSSHLEYNPFSLLRQKAVQNFIKRKFQFIKPRLFTATPCEVAESHIITVF